MIFLETKKYKNRLLSVFETIVDVKKWGMAYDYLLYDKYGIISKWLT